MGGDTNAKNIASLYGAFLRPDGLLDCGCGCGCDKVEAD